MTAPGAALVACALSFGWLMSSSCAKNGGTSGPPAQEPRKTPAESSATGPGSTQKDRNQGESPVNQQGQSTARADVARSIGSATMTADGTIILDLRAEGADGRTIGDARFVYPPGHKEYQQILTHLKGLKPGEQKPVPPWPDPK